MDIRVLLVDDHPIVCQGLRHMLELEEDIEVVGAAASGEEALEQMESVSPNIVLLDIRMPGMGGIETIRHIRERFPEASVIVLTSYGDQYLAQAIEAGALGYLVKDVGDEELMRAIRAVHRGESILDPSLSRQLFDEFASLAKARDSRKWCLSLRELEIIRLIAGGVTNKEIASQLFLSETTVKRGVSHILDKLGAKDRAEAVAKAYGRGLL